MDRVTKFDYVSLQSASQRNITEIWVCSTASPLVEKGCIPLGFYVKGMGLFMLISTDLFRNAVDTMGSSFVVLKPQRNQHGTLTDFIVTYMNNEARRTTNSPANADGASFTQLTGLGKDSALFEMFTRTMESGQTKNLRTRLNLTGGALSACLYNVSCARCDAGISITWQIDERQEKKSNFTAIEIFENWTNSFAAFELVTREDGREDLRLLAANRTFADLISHDFETLPGTFFSDTCTVGLDWLPFYIKTAKNGVSDIHESYNHGLKKYLSAVQFSPVIGQVALLVLDRTHFWKTEQALRGRNNDLAMLFSSMASGCCVGKLVRNEQGDVVDVLLEMANPAYELLEGFPTATLQGRYLSEIEDGNQSLLRYIEVVEAKSKITFTKYIPATGVTVEAVCFSHDEDRFLCVQNNVTARVNAETALLKSKEELAEKHRIIMSSIDYASKIQRHLLPQEEDFQQAFSDHAVTWYPRDIVGGDIYWLKNFAGGSVLCVCDCTGHGAPGAFLTMLVVSAFESIVTEQNYQDTPNVIWELEQRLVDVLNVHTADVPLGCSKLGDIKDGCDLAVLSIANNGNVTISSGNTHVFVCDGHEVMQIKGQKIFVGEGKLKSRNDLRTVYVPANLNHKFYIASDGFFDQIGQDVHRPFGYQAFKQIILANHAETLNVVSQKLWSAFEDHRGTEQRRDDVQIIAFQK